MNDQDFNDQVEELRAELECEPTPTVLGLILAGIDELNRRMPGPVSTRLSVFRAYFYGMGEEAHSLDRAGVLPSKHKGKRKKRTGDGSA